MNCTVPETVLECEDHLGRALWVALDVLLMLAILAGNVPTVYAMACCRHLSMLISNQFVASLAVSDLLVGLSLPYHTAFYLCARLGTHPVACLLRFVLLLLSCCASICSLIGITVDRYISIVYPLHYNCWITEKVVGTIVAVGWLVALIIATVPTYWNNWKDNTACEMDKVLPWQYVLFIITPAFLLVWVAMVFIYWRIWREAARQARNISQVSICHSGSRDKKSIQVVMMVMVSFSICWLPFFIASCVQVMGVKTQASTIVYKFAFSLGIANSFMNPMIYAWKNPGFKHVFMQLLCCQKIFWKTSPKIMQQTQCPSISLQLPIRMQQPCVLP
ncbi:histamine H2 receptor-like [Bacillus rossius redtenbacheri]|uniref:histamine H2 receptor-like n=1 Tax=Bacillus rossius redtenbacheri TaxID=93214 RepID=UPI002FDEEB3B